MKQEAAFLFYMAKRFTDTNKFDDPWYCELSNEAKVAWEFILAKCDQSGVWEPNFRIAKAYVPGVDWDNVLHEFGDRILVLPDGKWWVKKFIKFQYGKLSKACKPHAPVFAALEKHGINIDDVDQNGKYTEVVSSNLREKIIKRDGLICVYTGRNLSLKEAVIDHIKPRAKGGKAVPSNLVVCCPVVNNEKSDMSVEEFCKIKGFSFYDVKERLRKATSKAIEGFHVGSDSLQEKEEDKYMDKDIGGAGGKSMWIPFEPWMPESLRLAFSDWRQHLAERGVNPTTMQQKSWFMDCQRHGGVAVAERVIRFSISKGAKSLLWDSIGGGPLGGLPEEPELPDWKKAPRQLPPHFRKFLDENPLYEQKTPDARKTWTTENALPLSVRDHWHDWQGRYLRGEKTVSRL